MDRREALKVMAAALGVTFPFESEGSELVGIKNFSTEMQFSVNHYEEYFSNGFKDVSVWNEYVAPLVRNFYKKIQGINELVQVEILDNKDGTLEHKWKCILDGSAAKDVKETHNVDLFSELINIIALEVDFELTRKILHNIRNHKSINKNIYRFDWDKTINENFVNMFNIFDNIATGCDAEWIVAAPEMCCMLEAVDKRFNIISYVEADSCYGLGIYKKFYLDLNGRKIVCYCDPLFPVANMLFGSKRGYKWSPYTVFDSRATEVNFVDGATREIMGNNVQRFNFSSLSKHEIIDSNAYGVLIVERFLDVG